MERSARDYFFSYRAVDGHRDAVVSAAEPVAAEPVAAEPDQSDPSLENENAI